MTCLFNIPGRPIHRSARQAETQKQNSRKTCFTLTRPGFFGAPKFMGHIVPPFGSHVSLVLSPYCLVFPKACRELDYMTHGGFHRNAFECFKVVQMCFYTKKSN